MAAAQQSSALRDMLAVLRGLRNGVVYGAKVRFPHALVMTFLFQSGRCVCSLSLSLSLSRARARLCTRRR
jgi:hypothetical protein